MPRRSRKHPGVWLVKRQRGDGVTHYARWRDPFTGKLKDTNLTSLRLTNKAQRQRWAERKSQRLAEIRASMTGGGRPLRDELGGSVDLYLEAAGARVRPDTLRSYREAVLGFSAWGEASGVKHVQELDRAALFRYRAHLASDPRKGARTVNSRMLRLKAALNWWRRAGMLPQLTGEGISDSLKGLKAPRPEPDPLRPEELLALVESSDDVDLQVILFYLLTGLRLSEGLRLPWSAVHPLELHVTGWSKTGAGRVIELDVCPFLPPILKAWKKGRTGPTVLDGWTKNSLRCMRERAEVTFTWQRLRQTCGTYLTNAPGIYGGASAFKSARRLGHSVEVAEKFYVGRARPPKQASTIEEALGIASALRHRGLRTNQAAVMAEG